MKSLPFVTVSAFYRAGAWKILPRKTGCFDLDASHRSYPDGPVISASAAVRIGPDGTIAGWSHSFYRFAVQADGTIEGPVFRIGSFMDAVHRDLKAKVQGAIGVNVRLKRYDTLVKQEFEPDPEMVAELRRVLAPAVVRRARGERPHGVSPIMSAPVPLF